MLLGAQLANYPYVTAEQVEMLKSVNCRELSDDFLSGMKQFS